MCSMGQVKPEHQKEVFSELVSLENSNQNGGSPSEEDFQAGFNLFQSTAYCPTMVTKLFRFVNHILSNESERTIIQTFVNLFQTGALSDPTSFTLARKFFFVLASTLNLQYGNVLLATSTQAQLQAVLRNGWPFFANNSDAVEKCLDEIHCDRMQDILQQLGNMFVFC